ncbi:MAG: glucosamine-6-phosphate deaminase [Candidatus Limnocylindrales bacterium]
MVELVVWPRATWAERVAAELATRLVERPSLRICLPTGDTPSPVYAALLTAEARGEASFGASTVVMLDEWVGLPSGDPARCDVRLRTELLDRLGTPPAAFAAIDVDASDPEAAAGRHDAAARGLDLAVLGLGMNGHVGFNEPGSRPDDPTRLVCLAISSREAAVARYGATRVPTAGITVGLARLLESREAWLLVTGERKASMLRRALDEPEEPDCPASYLRRHSRLTVFADDAAAGLLRGD